MSKRRLESILLVWGEYTVCRQVRELTVDNELSNIISYKSKTNISVCQVGGLARQIKISSMPGQSVSLGGGEVL